MRTMTSLKSDNAVDDPKYQLVYQMSRITKERGSLAHNNHLESVTGTVAYWVEKMGRSQELVMDQDREELLQQELDRFMHHFIAGRPQEMVFWGSH